MFVLFHLTPAAESFVLCRNVEQARAFWNAEPAVAHLAHYTPVALVNTDELERVFELTNHIDRPWTTGPSVLTLRRRPRGERSTSVGDMVLDTATGRLYFCAPEGWDEVRWPVLSKPGLAVLNLAVMVAA